MPPDRDMDELLALENYLPQDRLGDQKKLKGGEEENEQTELAIALLSSKHEKKVKLVI